MQNALVSFIS